MTVYYEVFYDITLIRKTYCSYSNEIVQYQLYMESVYFDLISYNFNNTKYAKIIFLLAGDILYRNNFLIHTICSNSLYQYQLTLFVIIKPHLYLKTIIIVYKFFIFLGIVIKYAMMSCQVHDLLMYISSHIHFTS